MPRSGGGLDPPRIRRDEHPPALQELGRRTRLTVSRDPHVRGARARLPGPPVGQRGGRQFWPGAEDTRGTIELTELDRRFVDEREPGERAGVLSRSRGARRSAPDASTRPGGARRWPCRAAPGRTDPTAPPPASMRDCARRQCPYWRRIRRASAAKRMRGVANDEDASVGEMFGDQAGELPLSGGDDVEGHVVTSDRARDGGPLRGVVRSTSSRNMSTQRSSPAASRKGAEVRLVDLELTTSDVSTRRAPRETAPRTTCRRPGPLRPIPSASRTGC